MASVFGFEKHHFQRANVLVLVYDINSTLPQVCNFCNFYNILNTMSMKPRVIKKSEAWKLFLSLLNDQ